MVGALLRGLSYNAQQGCIETRIPSIKRKRLIRSVSLERMPSVCPAALDHTSLKGAVAALVQSWRDSLPLSLLRIVAMRQLLDVVHQAIQVPSRVHICQAPEDEPGQVLDNKAFSPILSSSPHY
jgi:hypothetical protein